jgi:hypothetical protein
LISECGAEPQRRAASFLTEIKEPRRAASDPYASTSMGCVMTTGGILFLILVLAATGIFAGVLAYYSRG